MENNNTAGRSSSSSGDKPKNHKNHRPKQHRKRRSRKLIHSSVQKVVSNNDLLNEILLRLPDLSLILFKSVSKRWLSLIKHPSFISRRKQLPKLDPPCGMFLKLHKSNLSPLTSFYEFVPSDTRVPVCINVEKAFTFGPPLEDSKVEILHSCNGLFLCRLLGRKIYVCNPSVSNMFKLIPYPDNVWGYLKRDCLSLVFDPTKSPYYKVIYGRLIHGIAGGVLCDVLVQIHTYSSETGNWSLCWDEFCAFREGRLICFKDSVYWKDAIYWLNDESKYSKLDIVNDHLVLTTLRTPLTLDMRVHYECRLFESHGCLLLLGKDDPYSRHFSIYEKKNVNSEWSLKYIVDLDDILMPFPRGWSIHSTIIGIILGGRDKDSLLVLKLDKRVVQHKITSKTLQQKIMSKILCTISNLKSHDDIVRCFHFIPSFSGFEHHEAEEQRHTIDTEFRKLSLASDSDYDEADIYLNFMKRDFSSAYD